jgi:hypothetical protein
MNGREERRRKKAEGNASHEINLYLLFQFPFDKWLHFCALFHCLHMPTSDFDCDLLVGIVFALGFGLAKRRMAGA